MGKKCKHQLGVVGYSFVNGNWVVETGLATPGRVDCAHCGVALPLGPARITPEVEVEIRAAEIAATFSEADWPFADWDTTQDENLGWRFDDRAPATRGYQSGYLARCIATHEEP